jgi:hypothetical protein
MDYITDEYTQLRGIREKGKAKPLRESFPGARETG